MLNEVAHRMGYTARKVGTTIRLLVVKYGMNGGESCVENKSTPGPALPFTFEVPCEDPSPVEK